LNDKEIDREIEMVDSVVSNGSSISRTVQLRSSVLTFASCTSVTCLSLSLSVCGVGTRISIDSS